MRKEIWFIRHGESQANAGQPTDDPESIALTEKGLLQAQVLCEQVPREPGLFIMTPHIRNQQTAAPLLAKYPDVPTAIWPIQEFDFLSPLQCTGTTVEQRKPWVQAYWALVDPDFVHGIGAESFNKFTKRILAGLKKLENEQADFITVFAHGHVMRMLWQYLYTGHTDMHFYRDRMLNFPVPNTAIFKACYGQGRWLVMEPDFFYI
jgi:broad specificity phosphatase PhoE